MCTAIVRTCLGSFRASAANISGVRCLDKMARPDMALGKDASRKTPLRLAAAPAAPPKRLGRPSVGGYGDGRSV